MDAPAAVLIRSNHPIAKECVKQVFPRDGDRADVVGPEAFSQVLSEFDPSTHAGWKKANEAFLSCLSGRGFTYGSNEEALGYIRMLAETPVRSATAALERNIEHIAVTKSYKECVWESRIVEAQNEVYELVLSSIREHDPFTFTASYEGEGPDVPNYKEIRFRKLFSYRPEPDEVKSLTLSGEEAAYYVVYRLADYVDVWTYSGVEAYYKYGYDKVDVDKEEFVSRYKMLSDRHFSFANMLLSAYSELPDKYIEEYLPSRTVKVPGTDYEYVIASTEE